jgi:hypothetical protein
LEIFGFLNSRWQNKNKGDRFGTKLEFRENREIKISEEKLEKI